MGSAPGSNSRARRNTLTAMAYSLSSLPCPWRTSSTVKRRNWHSFLERRIVALTSTFSKYFWTASGLGGGDGAAALSEPNELRPFLGANLSMAQRQHAGIAVAGSYLHLGLQF